MLIIYCNIYRQKCRIFVNFRFHAETLMTFLKVKTSRQKKICCVCIESRAMLKFSESLNPKEPFIMKI